MNRKKILISFLFIGYILLLGVTADKIIIDNSTPTRVNNPNIIINLEPMAYSSGPIKILNNSAFGLYGFPGAGTENEPYIIENLIIRNSTIIPINIQGTTAHFEVRNCTLNGINGTVICLRLWNVMYGTIHNNTLFSGDKGTHTYNSEEMNFTSNIAFNNTDEGIRIEYAHNNVIQNNTCYNNGWGIYNHRSDNTTISDNTCYQNYNGINTYQSVNVTIQNNHAYNNTNAGIYLQYHDDLVNLTNNVCHDNDAYGIFLYHVTKSTIQKNTVHNNLWNIYFYTINFSNITENNVSLGTSGMFFNNPFTASKNNTIEYNNITNITLGIIFDELCHNNTIRMNSIRASNVDIRLRESLNNSITNNILNGSTYGVYLFDSANSSIVEWNTFLRHSNHSVDHGWFNRFQYNYYDDWTSPDNNNDGFVDIPYQLDGTRGNEDPYPIAGSSIFDNDEDGLSNFEEIPLGTDPDDPDTDDDNLSDGDEVLSYLTDPLDTDTDNDTLLDGAEVLTYGTNPLDNDTESDGMDDAWEVNYGTNPLIDDSNDDPDLDNLDNIGEYQATTDPQLNDTDGDGLPDGWEVTSGTKPLIDDAGDDPDNDTLTNLEEYGYETDPRDADTDDDNYSDGEEVLAGTDPLDPLDFPQEFWFDPEEILEDPINIAILAAASLAATGVAAGIVLRSVFGKIANRLVGIGKFINTNVVIRDALASQATRVAEGVSRDFQKIRNCPKCKATKIGPICYVCGTVLNHEVAEALKKEVYR